MSNSFKKPILLLCISALILTVGSAERVFHIEMDLHKNDTAKFNEIELYENGKPSNYYGNPGNYSYYLKNKNEEVLWEEERKFTWFMLSDPPQPIDEIPISKNIPYHSNATIFGLEKNNNTIIEVNIPDKICLNFDNTCSSYCEGKNADVDCTCGDGVCQESSNERELCPEDCGGNSGLEETNQQENNPNTGNSTGPSDGTEIVDSDQNTNLLLIIGVLAILFAVILASSKVKIEA